MAAAIILLSALMKYNSRPSPRHKGVDPPLREIGTRWPDRASVPLCPSEQEAWARSIALATRSLDATSR